MAAAICAALKKFAPAHAVNRVRSLSSALSAARRKTPDLVILDFDPPLAGVLDFLSLLREIAPAARVMIIAANLPQETLRDERLPTVFAFVEKPFQLAEFGAAITRLMSPSDPEPEDSSRTTLEAMGLSDLIPLLGIEGVAGSVGVTAAEGALVGELAFDQGKITTAAASGLQGIDALREMLRWPAPEFDFTEGASDAPPQMEGKWPRVLDKVIRSIPRPPAARLPVKAASKKSPKAARPKSPPPVVKDGKKILIIDDTETLRIFVEEMLLESDPRLQIVAAPDGASGVSQGASMRPDLILLDFSLPDFNGDEVCRRLLENDATREIPVIMMSGHVADMAEAAARYENIVLTLSKPFVSSALIKAVTKMLTQPPERRRREAEPEVATPDLLPSNGEHATNGHAPRSVAALPPPAEPASEPASPVEHEAPSSDIGMPEPPALVLPAPHIPAHIAVASRDAVVVSFELDVVSMQFSPALHITHLQAQPTSPAVLLHVDPRAISAVPIPQIPFEIARALLDEHGQLQTLHLIPATRHQAARPSPTRVPVDRLALMPGEGQSGLQITPAAASHFTVRLLAAFDLVGVELSPTFSVSLFVLRARSGRMRVVLPAHGSRGGTIFEATRVLVQPTGGIAEIDLRVPSLIEASTAALPEI